MFKTLQNSSRKQQRQSQGESNGLITAEEAGKAGEFISVGAIKYINFSESTFLVNLLQCRLWQLMVSFATSASI